MEARLARNGMISAWRTRIAAPPTARELAERVRAIVRQGVDEERRGVDGS